MSIYTHIEFLKNKHRELENNIRKERLRPMPDFLLITAMKKRKLMLKEMIMLAT